jgi:hypothetical protein
MNGVRPVHPQAAGTHGDRAGHLRAERAAQNRLPDRPCLRDLRRIAEGAKNDLREGLGPEFADFEIEDLNPKRFMQKHLASDLNADQGAQQQRARRAAANGTPLMPGERPPFDPNAT